MLCFSAESKYRSVVLFKVVLLGLILSFSACSHEEKEANHITDDWEERGEELFYFGFPFVKNYSWMAESIYLGNSEEQTEWNTFLHFDPEGKHRNFSYVNPDVVHSLAYVDLRNGAVELVIPHIRDRYASVQIFELNGDNFLTLRSNESITRQRKYVLAPKHQMPICDADVAGLYISESPFLVIIARVSNLQSKGLPQVEDLLGKFKITPMEPSDYSLETSLYYDPSFHRDPMSIYNSGVFLEWLKHALKNYDFREEEEVYKRYLTDMGFWEEGFDFKKLPKTTAEDFEIGFQKGIQKLVKGINHGQMEVPGWYYGNRNIKYDGRNIFEKALSSSTGIPGVVESKSSYVRAFNDCKMQVLHAANTYRLHFAPQALPPVRSFWSLTAYSNQGESYIEGEEKSWFNSAKDGLHYHEDGSLTIYVGKGENRKKGYENWLELPTTEQFNLILRMYDVSEFVNGSYYQAPKIERL